MDLPRPGQLVEPRVRRRHAHRPPEVELLPRELLRFLLLRPFADDQQSNEAETTELLDEAIDILDPEDILDK